MATDPADNKKYLLCDYNRDGDSYRLGHPILPILPPLPCRAPDGDPPPRRRTAHLPCIEGSFRGASELK